MCEVIKGLIVGIAIFIVAGLLTWMIFGPPEFEPTAMDVYQGRTTLEITYKDGVPVDSVVVFKNK